MNQVSEAKRLEKMSIKAVVLLWIKPMRWVPSIHVCVIYSSLIIK